MFYREAAISDRVLSDRVGDGGAACAAERPRRILHIVGTMNHGGIESWLMRVLRATDRSRWAMDFLVYSDGPFDYSQEIQRLGGRLLVCPSHHRVPIFALKFRQLLRRYGPYDAVHSHVGHFSMFALPVARWAGVPVRIAHSHNDFSRQKKYLSRGKRLYWRIAPWAIRASATSLIGCSAEASRSLFGRHCQSDPRHRIVRCGIDFSTLVAWSNPAEREAQRRALRIPADARVVGHVGRFSPQKNHAFLLEIFQFIARQEPRAILLLIGQGELEGAMREFAGRLGIADRVIFAGPRNNAAQLIHDVMDIFLLPSRYEGLPLVLLEAQGAGTPSLISADIPPEADLAPALVHRRPLQDGAQAWASHAVALLAAADDTSARRQAAAELRRGDFSLDRCIAQLDEILQCGLAEGPP